MAKFRIGTSLVQTIIDTGASASFIPENGKILRENRPPRKPTCTTAKTADNSKLPIKQSIELMAAPGNAENTRKLTRFYILPDHSSILGAEAIIGLDMVKDFNISIKQLGGQLAALTAEGQIGGESQSKRNTVASIQASRGESEVSQKTKNLIEKYKDIFAESAKSFIKVEPMEIPLIGPFTQKAKLRRHSLEDIIEIKKQILRMLDDDIIEPSKSPFSSNAHLVPKKNGQKRLVINFIPLNRVSERDHYPIPQISDVFQSLRSAYFFTALDCTEGFLQIPVLKEHRDRTTFVTPQGAFQFKRVPFGYTNSPAKFQRTMNFIFAEGLYTKCVIYIDDILVFGRTEQELHSNTEWVFQKCRVFNVKLKLSKCKFATEKTEFLGFLVSHNQIEAVKSKCDPLSHGTPANKTDVLSILGSLNYYSRFIENFAEKTRPLRNLVKKKAKFEWLDEHNAILIELRKDLTTATPHRLADPYSRKNVTLIINHSTLETVCSDSEGNLLSRAGLALSTSQQNYTKVEKALMAINLAYDKFKILLGGPVTIKTTCKQLSNVLESKEKSERVERLLLKLPPDANYEIIVNPFLQEIELSLQAEEPVEEIFYTDGACIANGTSKCRASWAVKATMNPGLSAKGKVTHPRPSNQVAELSAALRACEIAIDNKLESIMIVSDSKYTTEAINNRINVWVANGWRDHRNKPIINSDLLQTIAAMKESIKVKCVHVRGHGVDPHNIDVDLMARSVLEEDICIASIVTRATIDQSSDNDIDRIKARLPEELGLQEKFCIVDDKLFFMDPTLPVATRNRLYVPQSETTKLIRIAHDDPLFGGHMGVKKTKAKLREYYWPHMNKDIEKYVGACETCQKFKVPRGPSKGLMQPIPISQIFDRIHVDIVGPIKASTTSGNKYIITAIDAFSRFGYARAKPEVKTTDIIAFLEEEIFTKYGVPESIVSDNGCQFTSKAFVEFVKQLGIKQSLTSEYHPQSNGMDERFNGTLVKILKNYLDKSGSDWDKNLKWALFLYNNTPNESTQLSPFVILHGVSPRTPLSASNLTQSLNEDGRVAQHESIRKTATENIICAQNVQKYYYDNKRKQQDFKLLDLVLLRRHCYRTGESKKLAWKFEGPYIITKFIQYNEQPQAVVILHINRMVTRKAAFQDLKLFHVNEASPCSPREQLPGEKVWNNREEPKNVSTNQTVPPPISNRSGIPTENCIPGSNNDSSKEIEAAIHTRQGSCDSSQNDSSPNIRRAPTTHPYQGDDGSDNNNSNTELVTHLETGDSNPITQRAPATHPYQGDSGSDNNNTNTGLVTHLETGDSNPIIQRATATHPPQGDSGSMIWDHKDNTSNECASLDHPLMDDNYSEANNGHQVANRCIQDNDSVPRTESSTVVERHNQSNPNVSSPRTEPRANKRARRQVRPPERYSP